MDTVKINVNVDKQTKLDAEKVFDAIGMNMTTAINVFLKKAIAYKGIPFDVRVPNKDTIEALNEVEEMEKNPNKYVGYNSIADLRKALEE